MRVRFPDFHLSVEAEPDIGLLDLALRHSVPLVSYCGGRGTCGKCRVRVDGEVSPLSSAEKKLLAASLLASGERLACQVQIRGDAEVTLLQAARSKMEKALGQVATSFSQVDPGISKWSMPRPEHLRTPSTSDWEILRGVMQERGVADPQTDLRTLQGLGDRIWGWPTWTLVVGGSRLLGIEPGVTSEQLYGMAFDIGTTSVVGYLLDLREGRQLALSSMLNPQAAFGADVISRISLASKDPSGLALLQGKILQAIRSLIEAATASAKIERHQLYALSIVGNTTMHHLLLGLDPSGMGHLPYNPVITDPLELRASDLGMDVHPQAFVHLLPNISGYVGSDIVAGILCTRLHKRKGIALAIDIGTNGEIVLGSSERMLASSAAAGPAFEGAQISCGMRAEPGAIGQIFWEDGDVRWKVLGEVPPQGLCGSGLVDLVALLRRLGLIDEGGRFIEGDQLGSSVPLRARERLQRGEEGLRFLLVAGGGSLRPVYLTQRDIRELQLAKGAIRAGINILMDELHIEISQIEEILLAGAFGNYIDPANALAIGLLPPFPRESIHPVGNAAGEGGKLALLSRQAREEALQIAQRAQFVELASRADFQERFVEALSFPNPENGG